MTTCPISCCRGCSRSYSECDNDHNLTRGSSTSHAYSRQVELLDIDLFANVPCHAHTDEREVFGVSVGRPLQASPRRQDLEGGHQRGWLRWPTATCSQRDCNPSMTFFSLVCPSCPVTHFCR